jgi:hypothetical protein
VAWTDARVSDLDVYAQRVDGHGRRLWGSTGIEVITGGHNQFVVSLAQDGAGGAFVGWADGGYYTYAYSQRLDRNGVRQWADDGVLMSHSDSHDLALEEDGSGGVIAVWRDLRVSGYSGFAQLLDTNGTPRWTADAMLGSGGDPLYPQPEGVVSDGAGGLISLATNGNVQITAQRITRDAAKPWGPTGVGLSGIYVYPTQGRLVSDGAGGAIAVWTQPQGSGTALFAARVDDHGNTPWENGGVQVLLVEGTLSLDDQVSDAAGGAILAWHDDRSGSNDVFLQRVDRDGNVLWGQGVAVGSGPRGQFDVSLTPDARGGAFAAWTDNRAGVARYVFRQHVTGDGQLAWGDGGVGELPSHSVASLIRTVGPNPSHGDLAVWFSLPDDAPAELGLFDVFGRRLERRAVGDFGSGIHRIQLYATGTLRPGVYVVALEREGQVSTRKVAVLR